MIYFYVSLAAFLWGSYIGGRLCRGYARDKVQLSRVHALIGALVFTVPAAASFLNAPLTDRGLLIAAAAAVTGFMIGFRVGITTYWID